MAMINHFVTMHFQEVKPYKTYNYPEFRKKIIRIFKTPDLSHVNIKELMSARQKDDESILDYRVRVQDNVAKAFAKLSDMNSQNLAMSMFCQGLCDQEVARMTAISSKGDVASTLRIAASATAYGREQRYCQRYEPSRRRYPTNFAVDDDQQADADVEGDECDVESRLRRC